MRIERVIEIAKQAGAEILDVYQSDFSAEQKADKSPLTEADLRANNVIVHALKEDFPEIPIISEETKTTAYEERKNWQKFWLVDPLDGTKEFIKKNGEFTVNIALIENGQPTLGVVYVPVSGETFYAMKGSGCFKLTADGSTKKINKRDLTGISELKVVASRSHLSQEVLDYVEKLKEAGKEVEFISAGSSLKFCLLAEGKADIYPRFGPTMEWDTGAAHIVAAEAGLTVKTWPEGVELSYNKENLLNPYFIVS